MLASCNHYVSLVGGDQGKTMAAASSKVPGSQLGFQEGKISPPLNQIKHESKGRRNPDDWAWLTCPLGDCRQIRWSTFPVTAPWVERGWQTIQNKRMCLPEQTLGEGRDTPKDSSSLQKNWDLTVEFIIQVLGRLPFLLIKGEENVNRSCRLNEEWAGRERLKSAVWFLTRGGNTNLWWGGEGKQGLSVGVELKDGVKQDWIVYGDSFDGELGGKGNGVSVSFAESFQQLLEDQLVFYLPEAQPFF